MRLTTGPSGEAPRRRARAGFTLLELVLVMVIMCTVLAMAAPSLHGFFSSRRVADAAAQVVALTELARSQAVSEGRSYRLNVDAEEGTYWLTAQEGGAFQRISSEFGRTFRLPEGASVEWDGSLGADGRIGIAFHAVGTTEPGILLLTGAGGEVEEIICRSATEGFEVAVPNEREQP